MSPPSEANAIELLQLAKHFGSARAVDRVTFSVPSGSIFGLIGPNGAGKTTTFSIVAGYLEPSAGTARVLGHDPRDTDALAGRLGVLPQDAVLPASEPVGAFLLFLARLQGLPAGLAEKAARDALARVDGSDWWKTPCGRLSHGMAKRVGIAQALLGRPEVVLLDEPTAGLDPMMAWQIRQLVKSLRGECTVVVSSHNLQELEEVCDRAAILDRGRLAACGTLAELTAAESEIEVLLASDPPALEVLRAIAAVRAVDFDPVRRTLLLRFDRTGAAPRVAEDVIADVLRVLLDAGARISGLSKGRSLEQRVIELTHTAHAPTAG